MPIIAAETLLQNTQPHDLRLAIITKSDPFLSYWSEKILRKTMCERTTTQTIRYPENTSFQELRQTIHQNDLFSSHKTFIIHISKPNTLKEECLDEELIHSLNQTKNRFLCIIGGIQSAHSRSKWYKNLAKNGIIITTKALTNYKIPTWLHQLSTWLGKPIPLPLCKTIAHTLDHHLASIEQLCSQMQIQNIQPPYQLEKLQSCMLTTPNPGPIYSLLDHICYGDLVKCQLGFAKSHTKETLTSLYWMLLKRLRQTLMLYEKHKQTGTPLPKLLEEAGIWSKQQPIYLKTLRVKKDQLYEIYHRLCQLEWMLKGSIPGNFLQTFQHTAQQLCQAIYDKP